MSKWRYQPVFIDQEINLILEGGTLGGGMLRRLFGLIEVQLENDDTLRSWTELDDDIKFLEPLGEDNIADLRDDMAKMMRDAQQWKPVNYADLRVGMTFQREDS